MGADLAAARAAVLAAVGGLDRGEPLDALTRSYVLLGAAASPTALDNEGAQRYAAEALDRGATADQVAEVIVLASAVGVHALHEGMRVLADLLAERGDPLATAPLDEQRLDLRRRHVGDQSYWNRLEDEIPGFLDALLRLHPGAYTGFFAFCAIPWSSGALDAVTKELVYVGLDATPSHRYLPGLRLHVANALRLGASPGQILEVVDLAATAAEHRGIG